MNNDIFKGYHKSFWVYVGNIIGIVSVFMVLGLLFDFVFSPALPNGGLFSPLCRLAEWWLDHNIILLNIGQVISFVAFLFLLFSPTRNKGVSLIILLIVLYLFPLEFARFMGCWQ
jgi:hypothetical protein